MAIEVLVRDNNVEKALRVLKKKLQKDGLFRELRMRQFYEKPSLKKQRKEERIIKTNCKRKKIKKIERGRLKIY